jgi:hypothetical protein
MKPKFSKADDYTIEAFNPYGINPYKAILMATTSKAEGFAPYHLTVLKNDAGGFYAAHGSRVETMLFKTVQAAKAWVVKWYLDNRQLMYMGGKP